MTLLSPYLAQVLTLNMKDLKAYSAVILAQQAAAGIAYTPTPLHRYDEIYDAKDAHEQVGSG